MFRFEVFEEEHLLAFLKQGYLDDYIEEIIKRFYFFSPQVQFNLLLYIREKLRDILSPKVLARGLRISTKDAEKILVSEGKIFEILLTQKELGSSQVKAKIGKGLVIGNTSKIITNLSHLKPKLRILKKLLNQNFAVFFEDYFYGDSFMLPLAVTLSISKIPQDLRFTGKLNQRGDILEVENIKEKTALCEKLNLRLITPLKVKKFEHIKTYLEKRDWLVPFYITSAGREEYNSFLKFLEETEKIDFDRYLGNLTLFYGLKEEDFYIVTGQLKDQSSWIKVCEEFYQKLYKIKNLLPGNKTFHLAIRGPVALSFGLGVIFSHFDPFVFYHYQALQKGATYHSIPVLTPRILKERLKNYEILKPTFEKGGEDLVIILNFSHHEPLSDVKKYVSTFLEHPSFAVLESEWKGNLPIEKFLYLAREAASYLQEIRQTYSFRSYHFFFSCPLPIAFMIGLAFGHYVDGSIYNYQKEGSTYEQVLDFKILRKIREKMSENS